MNLLFANDSPGTYPPSLYAAQNPTLPPFTPLRGAAQADVAVIGAGFTGLSAAMRLARAGRRVIVLEAQRVGFGASGRNGGQVGSGQRLEVAELEALAGRDAARRLWDLSEAAKALTFSYADAAGVACHRGIAHCARTKAEVAHAADNAERLARDYGYDKVTPLDRSGLQALVHASAYAGGDIDRGAGHLDPLALCLGMARLADKAGVTIHENSLVTHIAHGTVNQKSVITTRQGRVTCDHIIIAANGYLGDLDRQVAARVMPLNNYIIATEPLGDRAATLLSENIAAHDSKFVVNYWRLSDDQRLIFGGGETVSYRFPKDIAAMVRRPLMQVYPQLDGVRFDYAWGGTLAITMNRMPCFLRPAPNALSASGFSGHGVALSNLAGQMMADAVMGQAEGFETMAAITHRPFPGGAALRWPLLVAGMAWYGLRDRLGV